MKAKNDYVSGGLEMNSEFSKCTPGLFINGALRAIKLDVKWMVMESYKQIFKLQNYTLCRSRYLFYIRLVITRCEYNQFDLN